MNNEAKKMLFWWYMDNTPANEILPFEKLTVDYMLQCKLFGRGGVFK